jgi:hypothetical protein
MDAPLPWLAKPTPMGRIKTVSSFIVTVALSFRLLNVSRLPARSSQESVSQAGPECQGGAAANLRDSFCAIRFARFVLRDLLRCLRGQRAAQTSTTIDVAKSAKILRRLPDEIDAQSRYPNGGWVKGSGLVLQVFSFSLCYDRRCVGAGGRGFFGVNLLLTKQ